jgi:hypothetical protein
MVSLVAMSATTAPTLTGPTPTGLDRRLAHLDTLAEIGVELARSLHRTVLGAEAAQNHAAEMDPTCTLFPPADVAAVAQAFGRIARAVRMTVALHGRLEAGPSRRAPGLGAPARPSSPRIARETASPNADPEADPRERLYDHEDSGDLPDRPAAELIAWICRDLGLGDPEAAAVQARWAQAEAADDPTGITIVDPGFRAAAPAPARAAEALTDPMPRPLKPPPDPP